MKGPWVGDEERRDHEILRLMTTYGKEEKKMFQPMQFASGTCESWHKKMDV